MAVPRTKQSSTNDRRDPYAKFEFGEFEKRPNGIEETFQEIEQMKENAKGTKRLMTEEEFRFFCAVRRRKLKLEQLN